MFAKTFASAVILYCLLWFGATLSHGVYAQSDSDAASVEERPTVQETSSSNPCPEGEFLDLRHAVCRPLVKDFGFNAAHFAERVGGRVHTQHVLDTCDVDALIDVLAQVDEDDGGTVHLPACIFSVDRRIYLPSHMILQGAGVDKTVFRAANGYDSDILLIKGEENVIVRDLTVDGANTGGRGVFAWYAKNVLFERLDVQFMNRVGIRFRYTKDITIRYTDIHDSVQWHGIGSKDCFPGEDDIPDSEECAAQLAEYAEGVDWMPDVQFSQDYAIYSNRLYNNGSHGLDSHASQGEIAGNLIYNNAYGTKFPDASNLWIHHNRIDDSTFWGMYVYSTIDIPDRAPRNIVFYNNTLGNNGLIQIRVKEPARDVYLLHNKYEGLINVLRVADSVVYRCLNSNDALLIPSGHVVRFAPATHCDLTQVADLFTDAVANQ